LQDEHPRRLTRQVLVPCETGKPKDKVAAIEKFISYIRKNPVRKTGDIKALIEEGRM
jgi:hypothetical protein